MSKLGDLLAFRRRWEGGLAKDETGAFFLDLDPDCFTKLVAFLRTARLAGPDKPPAPPVISPDIRGWVTMMLRREKRE
jgi:hypothetical protein